MEKMTAIDTKKIELQVHGMTEMLCHAMMMNIYGKKSDSRDQVLADIIHRLANHIGNETLTDVDVMNTRKELFAFVQAARQEWEIIEP